MQGWTCLPDTEEVQDARVSLQVSGKQPFQNAFTFHCYIFTQDLMRSSLAKPCSYKCILHQQLECKLIQTREDPRLFVLSLFAIILNCTYTYLYYLLLICVFLCFPWDPSRSRWIPTCNHSVAGLARPDRALCCWCHGRFQICCQEPWRWHAANARRGGSNEEKPRGVPFFYKSVSHHANHSLGTCMHM